MYHIRENQSDFISLNLIKHVLKCLLISWRFIENKYHSFGVEPNNPCYAK